VSTATKPTWERGKWPKQLPPLTAEQTRISDEFMKIWHEILPRKYGAIENFNHGFPVKYAPPFPGCRTLEIGAGLGEHLNFENHAIQDYHCVELRETMAAAIKTRFADVATVAADCQVRLPYPDGRFDRVLAIHVLEHLPNLPAAIDELWRLLAPDGTLCVVIPCDPGLLYEIARKISAERVFRKRYKQSYRWLIRREHINSPAEIRGALARKFSVERTRYFPFVVPVTDFNLVVGMVLKKKVP
jgi:SAM-dependent methyltransferase